jgi:hypothetical protein
MRTLKGRNMQLGGRGEVSVAVLAAHTSLQSAYFLIANLELESPVSHSKQRTAAPSNRKFIAVFKPEK